MKTEAASMPWRGPVGQAPAFTRAVLLDADRFRRVLTTTLIAGNAVAAAAVMLWADFGPFTLISATCFDAGCLAVLHVGRGGRVTAAGRWLSSLLLAMIVLCSWKAGGVYPETLMTMLVVIVLSGVLVGHEATAGTGIAAVGSCCVLAAAESLGWLPARSGVRVESWTVVVFLANAGVLLALQYLVTGVVEHARALGREGLRAEARLQSSEATFAAVFSNAPLFMATLDVEAGTFLDVNAQGLRLARCPNEIELAGRTPAEVGLFAPAEWERLIAEVRASGKVTGMEIEVRALDGSTVWTVGDAQRLWIHARDCMVLSLVDVTAARRARDEVRQLSQVIEQSPFSVVITDTKGAIEYVNSSFTATTGYSAGEVRGRHTRLLKHGDTPASVYQQLWKTVLAGRTWRGTLRNAKKDGSPFWEDITISPVRSEAGKIEHFVAIKCDLTAHKLLEEQYRQAQKMETVGLLAGGVAHDYNNILTATSLRLDLMLDDNALPVKMRHDLEELRKFANRAVRLTRQLLTFSRKHAIRVEPVEVRAVIQGLIGMLLNLLGETVKVTYQPGSTPLGVVADIGMIEQVVTNLAVNARDAMAPQGGVLSITSNIEVVPDPVPERMRKPGIYPGRFVVIALRDSGCGMSAATLARVFEPFFTTKEPGKGTGLGLATVLKIVEQHHGWVDVKSAVGLGTTFRVYLPAADLPLQDAQAAARSISRGEETLLLVEDDDSVRSLEAAALRRCGYNVIEASSGSDALLLFSERPHAFSLVITDMVMPSGISGTELARAMRALSPGVKVLLCSGYSQQFSAADFIAHTGFGYIQKPINLTKLAGVVRDILDGATEDSAIPLAVARAPDEPVGVAMPRRELGPSGRDGVALSLGSKCS